jgi:four helix bundle protein
MGQVKRFEDMKVWKSARKLTGRIYAVSNNPLFSRDYGLRDQIRRAAVSIFSSIAEGFESQSNPGFCRFLSCAKAPAAEVRAQLYLASDIEYLSQVEIKSLVSEAESISRPLFGLIAYLKRNPPK